MVNPPRHGSPDDRLPQPIDPTDPLCWRRHKKGQKQRRGEEDGASPSGGSQRLVMELQHLVLLKAYFPGKFLLSSSNP